jgi:hypothetical protein
MINALCAVVAALLPFSSLVPLTNKKPHDPKRRSSIQPPSTDSKLCQERSHYHERKPPAGDALDGIRAQRMASERVRQMQLASG